MAVLTVDSATASDVVVMHHYLHRKPTISYAYGLFSYPEDVQLFGMLSTYLKGVVTFGVPASRHLQRSACPTDPDSVIELNRLWVDDEMPRNTESWFVSRSLKLLPPRIVVSYADPAFGHVGYVYRALNFHYAGWTDMDRKTPRFDYLPADPTTHTRDAYRHGFVLKSRRVAKVKYWTVSGIGHYPKNLERLCAWPRLDWKTPPPVEQTRQSTREMLQTAGLLAEPVTSQMSLF